MKPIIFTMHPENLNIDEGEAICVYHKQYKNKLPEIKNCDFIEFDLLSKTYKEIDYFKNKETVIFIGGNKFFNPASRIHPVFELIPYGFQETTKLYSIDCAPYIGDLWRVWAHYYLTKVPTGEYTYSYLLESHYNAFLDGVRAENPLDVEIINAWAAGNVQIDYDKYFSEPSIKIIEMSHEVHEGYQKLKTELFDKYESITPVIKGLSDYAKKRCKDRKIPQEFKIFETPSSVQIVRTDLKVDEYLTNKLVSKMNEVNAVVGAIQ